MNINDFANAESMPATLESDGSITFGENGDYANLKLTGRQNAIRRPIKDMMVNSTPIATSSWPNFPILNEYVTFSGTSKEFSVYDSTAGITYIMYDVEGIKQVMKTYLDYYN